MEKLNIDGSSFKGEPAKTMCGDVNDFSILRYGSFKLFYEQDKKFICQKCLKNWSDAGFIIPK